MIAVRGSTLDIKRHEVGLHPLPSQLLSLPHECSILGALKSICLINTIVYVLSWLAHDEAEVLGIIFRIAGSGTPPTWVMATD